jgi:hypothetical protein
MHERPHDIGTTSPSDDTFASSVDGEAAAGATSVVEAEAGVAMLAPTSENIPTERRAQISFFMFVVLSI